ncbi:MAG: FAD:protein FMN transferase [Cellvibrionaceae bacterium]
MGTSVGVTLWQEDPEIARRAISAVMAEMRRIDNSFSPYKPDSELSRVNREAINSPVTISGELMTIIDKALYFSRASGGAFDISFASVGRHYDYRQGQQPSENQREDLLAAIDYRLIELDKTSSTVSFKHPQLQIDLGGIAKGYAVDRGIAILQQFDVTNATVSAGGDSRVLGDRRGRPWVIGIKNPRGQSLAGDPSESEDRVAIKLPLQDTAISTSGDYERFFIDQNSGERIHHILNPRTGKSVAGVTSVSILGPRGFDTDPLSTAVFVLGIERGLALVASLSGFDAIVIDSAGKVHYSDGLTPPVTEVDQSP